MDNYWIKNKLSSSSNKKFPAFLSGLRPPRREPWYAQDMQTGKVYGPIMPDPGTIWFETPTWLDRTERLIASRVHYAVLSAAFAGLAASHKLLPGSSQITDLQDLLFKAGMFLTTINGYLGDGAATGLTGLSIDDTKNGTTFSGYGGGAGGASSNERGRDGSGPGGGGGGAGANVPNQAGGGGGGYGAAGSNGGPGTLAANYGDGGKAHGPTSVWEALRTNTYTQAVLIPGGGGGGGGADTNNNDGGAGGGGGSTYVEISSGTLTTVARTLTGSNGSNGQAGTAGGGGGGSGGLWLGVAPTISYGSGTINTSAGSGGSGAGTGANGGAGGNGRAVTVYFDACADISGHLSGCVWSAYRILRSVPLGMTMPF